MFFSRVSGQVGLVSRKGSRRMKSTNPHRKAKTMSTVQVVELAPSHLEPALLRRKPKLSIHPLSLTGALLALELLSPDFPELVGGGAQACITEPQSPPHKGSWAQGRCLGPADPPPSESSDAFFQTQLLHLSATVQYISHHHHHHQSQATAPSGSVPEPHQFLSF